MFKRYGDLAALYESWVGPASRAEADTLSRAFNYSLHTPGKRFRPVLAMLAGEMLGFQPEFLRSFCLALEAVHTSSLVHDDLPALDNDTLRRGKPTVHVVFGEAVALLAGDALLGKAFAFLAGGDYHEPSGSKLLKLLANAVYDICEGQVFDLEAGGENEASLPLEERRRLLELRHRRKTGALIAAAASGPALLLEEPSARDEAFSKLQSYGYELGLLFQITDDILDATSTTDELGKHAANDEKLGRSTYVTTFGLEEARLLAAERCQRAKESLASFGDRAQLLREVADFVLQRKK